MYKEKLIILSDLWGETHSEWLVHYSERLKPYFDLFFYDCRVLAEMDSNELAEEKIHHHFVNGGVDRADHNLLLREPHPTHVLGFSVGGTIGWKSIQKGLKAKSLTAVSSTRLRYENTAPSREIRLYFGENDPFKPQSEWYVQLHLTEKIFSEKAHDFYRDQDSASAICNDIIGLIDFND
jgi:hypothetical protein